MGRTRRASVNQLELTFAPTGADHVPEHAATGSTYVYAPFSRERRCGLCGIRERQNPDAFYPHRKVGNRCRACHAARNREYDERNPDKVRERTERGIARAKAKRAHITAAYQARIARRRAEIDAAGGTAWAADYRRLIPSMMINRARKRAERDDLPFTITEADIVVPDRCPVLGIRLKLTHGPQTDASASLDKIVPELGYVPGNVRVISTRANTLKSNGTADEHAAIAAYIVDAAARDPDDDANPAESLRRVGGLA
jgi:hypothetical protein